MKREGESEFEKGGREERGREGGEGGGATSKARTDRGQQRYIRAMEE